MDKLFSTTRRVTKKKPVIIDGPEDRIHTQLFLPDNPQRKGEGGLRTNGVFKENHKDRPLVSIVTVVFNGEDHLEETILSVLEQAYDNVEYIIIDGGSSDGTLDIIKKHEDKIDYWVSEKDQGIYDAMNKGIKLCTGSIIGIINADDFYEKNAISESVKLLLNEEFSYSYGSINFIKHGGTIYKTKPVASREFGKKIFQEMVVPHISMFIKRDVYKQLGLFDKRYKIAGDQEFLVRMYMNGTVGADTDMIVASAYDGGISKGFSANIESARIAISYGQSKITTAYKFVSFVFKKSVLILLGERLGLKVMKLRKSRHV